MTTTEFEYIFQIPSYDRVGKQTTIKMLHDWGFPKEAIWVSVHDEEQQTLYE